MIHFFIVLCIWDLPVRHNFAHYFLQKKIFLLLHILYSYRKSIFMCGVFLFVMTFFFFLHGLIFQSAPSKYGSLHQSINLNCFLASRLLCLYTRIVKDRTPSVAEGPAIFYGTKIILQSVCFYRLCQPHF